MCGMTVGPWFLLYALFLTSFSNVESVSTEETIKYSVINEALTWNEAAAICHQMNASLLIVNEKSKLNHFRRMEALFEENHIQDLWIGLYHTGVAFDWNKCPDLEASPVVCDWYNWDFEKREPMFPELNKCAFMSSGSLMWRMQSCDTSLPFMCETPAVEIRGTGYLSTLAGSRISGWDKFSAYTNDVTDDACLMHCDEDTLWGLSCVAVDMNVDRSVCNLYFANDVSSIEAHEVPDSSYNLFFRLNIEVEVFRKSPHSVQEIRNTNPVFICSKSSSFAWSVTVSTSAMVSSGDGNIQPKGIREPTDSITSILDTKTLNGDYTRPFTNSATQPDTFKSLEQTVAATAPSVPRIPNLSAGTSDGTTSLTTDVEGKISSTTSSRLTASYISNTDSSPSTTDLIIPTEKQTIPQTSQYSQSSQRPTLFMSTETSNQLNTETVATASVQDITTSTKTQRHKINHTNQDTLINGQSVNSFSTPKLMSNVEAKVLTACRRVLYKHIPSKNTSVKEAEGPRLISRHNSTAARRRKTCATDDRLSAQTMGYSALIVILVVWGLFVLLDLETMYKKFFVGCPCMIRKLKPVSSSASFDQI